MARLPMARPARTNLVTASHRKIEYVVDDALIEHGKSRLACIQWLSDNHLPDEQLIAIFENLFSINTMPGSMLKPAQLDILLDNYFSGVGTVHLRQVAREAYWNVTVIRLDVYTKSSLDEHHKLLFNKKSPSAFANIRHLDFNLKLDELTARHMHNNDPRAHETNLTAVTKSTSRFTQHMPQLRSLVISIFYLAHHITLSENKRLAAKLDKLKILKCDTLIEQIKDAAIMLRNAREAGVTKKAGIKWLMSHAESEAKKDLWEELTDMNVGAVAQAMFRDPTRGLWV